MMPSLWFRVSDPDGEFVCTAWGLLFKGSVLTYDPTTNEVEWILIQGTATDLSLVEEASAWELSNILIQDVPEDVPRMDHFREHREKYSTGGTAEKPPMNMAFHEEESMDQAPQPGLEEEEGSDGSQGLESSENTPHCHSSRHCHYGSISWADEQEEEE